MQSICSRTPAFTVCTLYVCMYVCVYVRMYLIQYVVCSSYTVHIVQIQHDNGSGQTDRKSRDVPRLRARTGSSKASMEDGTAHGTPS